MNITLVDLQSLTAFWLVFTRWMGTLFQIPLFDKENVPPMVKVLFCLVISYAFFPKVGPVVKQEVILFGNHFVLLTILHAFIGLVIGYLAKIIFEVFLGAGHLLSNQMGFTTAATYDPDFGMQVSSFEKMIHWTLTILILVSGALLPLFKGIYDSFFHIGLNQVEKLGQSPEFFVEFFSHLFQASLLLAMPLIFANLTVSLIMGFLSRAVPQINILMMSFIINIGIGLLVFLIIGEEFFHKGLEIYIERLGVWFNFLR